MSSTDILNERMTAAQKLSYCAPKLTIYGRVRDLTQAAGGSPEAEQNCGNQRSRSGTRQCCDRTAKRDIVRIGTHPLGIGVYLFHYKEGFREQWGNGRQFGVMADEVEKVVPQAVSKHPGGYKVVDWAMLGMSPGGHVDGVGSFLSPPRAKPTGKTTQTSGLGPK